MEIKVVRQILEWNEDCHKEVQDMLSEKNVKLINIMGSPGAGKTTFILNLISCLKEKNINVGVIEGDIEGTIILAECKDDRCFGNEHIITLKMVSKFISKQME